MEKPVVGSIVVVVRFPFSNLQRVKRRPALVVARAEFDNYILAQITSKPYSSKRSIRIYKKDFKRGELPSTSYVRPDKLFTADQSVIAAVVGQIRPKPLKDILTRVRKLF